MPVSNLLVYLINHHFVPSTIQSIKMRSSDPSAPAPAALCAADTTGRGASRAWCCGVQVPDEAGNTEILHVSMYVYMYYINDDNTNNNSDSNDILCVVLKDTYT